MSASITSCYPYRNWTYKTNTDINNNQVTNSNHPTNQITIKEPNSIRTDYRNSLRSTLWYLPTLCY